MRKGMGIAGLFLARLLSAEAFGAGPVHGVGPHKNAFVEQNEPRLRMPGELTYYTRGDGPLVWSPNQFRFSQANDAPGLSFGSLHADGEVINGRRRVHYRIDGVSLMGGQIGGSLNHRGAVLTVRWTGN